MVGGGFQVGGNGNLLREAEDGGRFFTNGYAMLEVKALLVGGMERVNGGGGRLRLTY